MKLTIEQCVKYNFNKSQIEDACKDFKVDNFYETLQEIYDEAYRKKNEFQKLPTFDNYLQKRNLIQKFK